MNCFPYHLQLDWSLTVQLTLTRPDFKFLFNLISILSPNLYISVSTDPFESKTKHLIPAERSYYATFFTPRIQNVPTGMSDGLGVVQMHTMEFWYIEE